ncbi:MAG: glycoside hydrolase family 3 C-terminal domain-containing protein [Treponema sp.]|nr:glycoside hydrolase family 3 C-terminal domain-containing protein [Treponema sp.]
MKYTITELVSKMTLEEKAGMCSGEDFWHTKAVKRLGIPAVMVSDGPYGLRKQDPEADIPGVNESIKAVCFPAGSLTTCSFDRDMLRKEGETLGDECQAEDVSILLGPAVNIKRSPLCGRNFEYLSEDPYLAGQLAAAYTKGVESKNIGVSVKHFAANNQEYRRMSVSAEADERTLREIYLPAFETVVREAKPDTLMCSYNRINGVYSCENEWLLTSVLRKDWGFDGYVMSDWGAMNDRVKALKAGLELEMPSSNGVTDRQIVEAVKNGSLDEKILDTAVERILTIIFKFTEGRQEGNFDKEKHHRIAAEIAENSMVLLKNDSGILPLSETNAEGILFIGVFAKTPRIEGGGSSHINCTKITSALDAAKDLGLCIPYVQGYDLKEKNDAELLTEAVTAAQKAQKVVIFAGLPDAYESEGYDRSNMKMPENQNRLIHEVAAVQPHTVVVLHNGSPVEMPWVNDVQGILESYLGGEAVGTAQINLLFGKTNPSGKLAETFPLRLEDTPCYINFPGNGHTVEYKEGVFTGYRYYDKKHMNVLFPFGFGLSYTTFSYSNLRFSKKNITDQETVGVTFSVKNTGSIAGAEAAELYVADRTGSAIRPDKELKDFGKVFLEPGETKELTLTLDKRSFAWYNTGIHDWYAATGDYEILIGSSSRDIRLTGTIHVTSTSKPAVRVTRNTVLAEVMNNPASAEICGPLLEKVRKSLGAGDTQSEAANSAISSDMIQAILDNLPLRSIRSFGGITEEELTRLITEMNEALGIKDRK